MSAAKHTPGPWTAFKKNGKHVEADEWSTDCEGSCVSEHAPIKAGKQVVALVLPLVDSFGDASQSDAIRAFLDGVDGSAP